MRRVIPEATVAALSERVLAALASNERFGWQKRLAAEFGVSESYVSHLRVRLGVPDRYGHPAAGDWANCPECGTLFFVADVAVESARQAARSGDIRFPQWWLPTCSQSCSGFRAMRHKRGVE